MSSSRVRRFWLGDRVVVAPAVDDPRYNGVLRFLDRTGVVTAVDSSPRLAAQQVVTVLLDGGQVIKAERRSFRFQRPDQPVLTCGYDVRGARMGRHDVLPEDDSKWRCARLRFQDGCYDEGGAYWGSPANVYCAWQPKGTGFLTVRASSREEAKKLFESKYPETRFHWSR